MSTERMANRQDRIRERNIATCDLAMLLERRGKRQIEKSLRRLEFDATSAYGKHVRKIKLLEKEHKEKLSNETVSRMEKYLTTKFQPLRGKGEKHKQLNSSPLCSKSLDISSQSKLDICSGKKCLQFPCRKERTYHFMFVTPHSMKETREFIWRQNTTLSARNCENNQEEVDSRASTPVSYKGSMPLDDLDLLNDNPEMFPSESNFTSQLDIMTKNCNLTKKEMFLKATVQRKKSAVPKKVDISINYGKPSPWRILLRPVRPRQSELVRNSGRKILAF